MTTDLVMPDDAAEIATPFSRERALEIAASPDPIGVPNVFTLRQVIACREDQRHRDYYGRGGDPYFNDRDQVSQWIMSPTGRVVARYGSYRDWDDNPVPFHHDTPHAHYHSHSSGLRRAAIHSVICTEGAGSLEFVRCDRAQDFPDAAITRGAEIRAFPMRPGTGVFWGEVADQRWAHGSLNKQWRKGLAFRWTEPLWVPDTPDDTTETWKLSVPQKFFANRKMKDATFTVTATTDDVATLTYMLDVIEGKDDQ